MKRVRIDRLQRRPFDLAEQAPDRPGAKASRSSAKRGSSDLPFLADEQAGGAALLALGGLDDAAARHAARAARCRRCAARRRPCRNRAIRWSWLRAGAAARIGVARSRATLAGSTSNFSSTSSDTWILAERRSPQLRLPDLCYSFLLARVIAVKDPGPLRDRARRRARQSGAGRRAARSIRAAGAVPRRRGAPACLAWAAPTNGTKKTQPQALISARPSRRLRTSALAAPPNSARAAGSSVPRPQLSEQRRRDAGRAGRDDEASKGASPGQPR